MTETITIVDYSRVGKKGFPMHSAAFPDVDLPTKEVPIGQARSEQAVDIKQSLQLYTAEKRWQKETGGFELNGMHIATDDRSKLMLSGVRVAAEADPDFTTQWKAADGAFVSLSAPQLVAISNAVLAHVSMCFALEAQVLSQIADGTITDRSQVDVAFA